MAILITYISTFVYSNNIAHSIYIEFFASFQGILGQWGSVPFEKVFTDGEIWRCITHIYFHAGLIHMGMNMAALIIAGKYMEKKYGSIWYVLFFHLTAIIDTIITTCIFPSDSVGVSAGVFAVIGILLILLNRKQISIKNLK